ncbi:uncharacterized protein ACIQIH_002554 [Cyanocitta cristata]
MPPAPLIPRILRPRTERRHARATAAAWQGRGVPSPAGDARGGGSRAGGRENKVYSHNPALWCGWDRPHCLLHFSGVPDVQSPASEGLLPLEWSTDPPRTKPSVRPSIKMSSL